MAGRRAGVAHLRGPRLLSKPRRTPIESALDARGAALGFDCVGVDAAGRDRHARQVLPRISSTTARMATWTGWRHTPNAAIDPRVLWPAVRSIIMLGVNYGPDEDPLRASRSSATAARSRSMRRATTITTSSRRA